MIDKANGDCQTLHVHRKRMSRDLPRCAQSVKLY